MSGFLGQLGQKLAERWLTLLVLPGALYIAVAVAARTLGQAHPFALSRLTAQVTVWAKTPTAASVGGQVVLLASVLAASCVVGLSVQGLGSAVERLALAADWRGWPPPLRTVAARRVAARRADWSAKHVEYQRLRQAAAQDQALGRPRDPEERDRARRARDGLALEVPDRPTWSGDRINAAAVRLQRDHRIDLALIWPYLWLTLPDRARAEITEARQGLTRAAVLGAWAVLYLAVAILWWPAALSALGLALAARRRTRDAADNYAHLLEASTRLSTGELARNLGIDCDGPLPAAIGEQLTALLDTTPVPAPGRFAEGSDRQHA